MSEFYQQYFCPYCKSYSLIIEDNSRVAYAYLLSERSIISDVWLYNQGETPNKINWNDRNDMPFLNPREYILDNIIPIKYDSDIDLSWIYQDNLIEVKIYIRRELIAILRPKLFPSFSLLVCKDGPLAKKWNNDNSYEKNR